MHLPGVVRNDNGLRQWIATTGPEHIYYLGKGPLDCVDVSQNDLSDDAVEHLVNFLIEKSQPTLRLKLFNNKLREPLALCRLIEDQVCGIGSETGLRELHLSHNALTTYALERLLESVSRVSWASEHRKRPLWLRIEKNDGLYEGAQRVVEKARADKHLPQVCLEAGGKGKGKGGCSLTYCKHGADVHLLVRGK